MVVDEEEVFIVFYEVRKGGGFFLKGDRDVLKGIEKGEFIFVLFYI